MANKEQLAILRPVWNKWREESPDAEIELRKEKLFSYMITNYRANPFAGMDLQGAHLVEFDLRYIDLRGTDFRRANLSGADITGAKLYGSARENWIIDGIRCDYIYWDEAGEQRTPPDRDFRPGEFEELYKQLPTFEYIFEQGFTPLDPLIMDRVVQAVNERHKEFSLELVNFDKRGQPHATFTVCHLEHVEKAKQQLTVLYENTIAYLMKENEEKNRLIKRQNNFIDQLIKKTPSIEDLKQMGDTYNNYGQTGAMGKNASATGNTFQQITAELSRLHEEMQRSAKTPEQRAAAEDVAKAAQAASEQNEPAMQRHLKNAGKFVVDFAKNIVTDVTAEYLKKTLEM
ncbi:pentapeptide repeat-containing protein [Desulfobulbus sp. F5]|nr:pentapeptide repeat-containing protein [Desulfobulbus sp. F5]